VAHARACLNVLGRELLVTRVIWSVGRWRRGQSLGISRATGDKRVRRFRGGRSSGTPSRLSPPSSTALAHTASPISTSRPSCPSGATRPVTRVPFVRQDPRSSSGPQTAVATGSMAARRRPLRRAGLGYDHFEVVDDRSRSVVIPVADESAASATARARARLGVVRARWDRGRAGDYRQRMGLSLGGLSSGSGRTSPDPAPEPTISAPDHRQGRALHRDAGSRWAYAGRIRPTQPVSRRTRFRRLLQISAARIPRSVASARGVVNNVHGIAASR